jgi:hypothetical protein
MDLHWLKPLLGRPGPFTTVYLDATPSAGAVDREVVERWRAVRRGLEHQGAPARVLDEIAEAVATPDGRRGPHGRVLVADADGLVVDRTVARPPAVTTGEHGPLPAILPAVEAVDATVTVLVVAADRTGADLTRLSVGERDTVLATQTVTGEHDDVHKTREGGLSRRSQSRARDSWERNAEQVAGVVDRVVHDDPVDLVVLTGDVRAVALVREELGQAVTENLVDVPGARGDGVRDAAFAAHLGEAVDALRARRRASVLARYAEAIGRGDGAVTGLADVVEVARRGQVATLLLAGTEPGVGGPTSRDVWVGPEPLDLATTQDDLATIGVTGPVRKMAAPLALLRAAVGQDARLTFAAPGEADLVDGVGALLRWSDTSTPGGTLLSQSADRTRVRARG